MSRKIIIFIWLIFLSPFIGFYVLIELVTFNTISQDILNDRESGIVYFSDLENPHNNLATIIYSSDGKILGEYYLENRSTIKYSEISPTLIDALISTEDIRFRSHSGIDIRSLFRATYGAITGSGSSGGASTITQQLSKMLFTEKTSSGFGRVKQKLKEWVVAVELERRYSKNEILVMYLTKFDWIHQAVGITSASKIYFNTTPDKLTINQSAMLVGMLKNPSLYNPKRNPEGTKNRRNVVLSQMLKYNPCNQSCIYDFLDIIYGRIECTKKKCSYNKITQYEFDSLKLLPLNLNYQKVDHNEGPAPYFREQLRGNLQDWCESNTKSNGEKYNLYTDGLIVHTTIDSRIQKHAEQSVKQHISKLQKEFYRHWKGYSKAPYPEYFTRGKIDSIIDQGMRRSERYRKLKQTNKTEKEIREIFDKKVPTQLFSWDGEIDTTLSPRDSVIYHKFFIHAGMMSVDPNTGHVKAYVGGINHKYFKYDHVLQGTRQVGSTFKPFLYALAIQEGMSPCDEILNSPVVFDADIWGLDKDWIPYNSNPEFDGLYLPLKFGLANSINIMTASIMHQYGPKPVVDMARKMGVKSNMLAVPSICLGTFDLSVAEITGAYSTFVNKGVHIDPFFITKITDKNGVEIQSFQSKTNEALSAKTATLMVNLLRGVIDGVYHSEVKTETIPSGIRGTGMSLRRKSSYNLQSELGGKTGTTQNYSDGWFVGITPNLVTAVWTGCEDRSAHFRDKKGYGSYTALPIFGNYMRYIYDDLTKLKKDRSIALQNANKINNKIKREKEIARLKEKYDKEEMKITVREDDVFQYSSIEIKNWVESKMNCNQTEINPEEDDDVKF